ncbi:MAG: hypothetical protein COA79_03330 [Planctomycetota bacterium]|nr:MAG: hypothetical protein COA79_03330 [Planctomycetota bacterium]
MLHNENSNKKTFYLFILSCIPIFFILTLTGLYFIELEEWVKGEGEIIPENKSTLYLNENAILKQIFFHKGDLVKTGDLIGTFILPNSNIIEILANQNGIIFSSQLTETGKVFSRGDALVTTASNENRNIKITISEKYFVTLKEKQKIRYEPNTISIHANDYYWGTLQKVIPVATSTTDKKGNAQFLVEGDIQFFGDNSLNKDSLHHIPFGSTGKVSIGIGKKSLLKQLIGWN